MTARAVRGVVAASAVIAILTLLSRVVGLGRWLVFSHEVGASCVGTAYSTANTVPNVLYEVAAGGALAAVAVPLVAGRLSAGDDHGADQVVSALLTWALMVLAPLGLLLALLAGPIAGALVGEGACPGSRELVARMLVWFAPQVPLYGVGVVAAGALQARRRFTWPAVAPLLSSLVVIGAYLAYGCTTAPGTAPAALPGGALAVLAGGTTAGVVALSLPLLLPLRRSGARLRPTLRFPGGTGARARRLASAGLVALLAQQLAVLATVWVANDRGGTGVLNAYQYLQAVYVLPYAVLAVPVATAVFPSLSSAPVPVPGAEDGPPDPALQARLATSLRAVALAGSLGAAVLVAAAPAVGWFFAAIDAGRRGGAALDLAGVLPAGLVAFAPGLVGYSLVALLSRATYARGRPSAAAGWTAAGWLLAVAVPLVLTAARPGAQDVLVALGAGSSVGMSVSALGLLVAVRRTWGVPSTRGLGRALVGALVGIPLAALAGGLTTGVLGPAGGIAGGPGVPAPGVGAALLLGVLSGLAGLACWALVNVLLDREGVAALARRVSRPRARG